MQECTSKTIKTHQKIIKILSKDKNHFDFQIDHQVMISVLGLLNIISKPETFINSDRIIEALNDLNPDYYNVIKNMDIKDDYLNTLYYFYEFQNSEIDIFSYNFSQYKYLGDKNKIIEIIDKIKININLNKSIKIGKIFESIITYIAIFYLTNLEISLIDVDIFKNFNNNKIYLKLAKEINKEFKNEIKILSGKKDIDIDLIESKIIYDINIKYWESYIYNKKIENDNLKYKILKFLFKENRIMLFSKTFIKNNAITMQNEEKFRVIINECLISFLNERI